MRISCMRVSGTGTSRPSVTLTPHWKRMSVCLGNRAGVAAIGDEADLRRKENDQACTTLAYGVFQEEGAQEMIGQHTGSVEGRPFVLRLSKPGAAPGAREDEKDVPRLLADAATYLRAASQPAP
jgi:hypothetical protein